MSHKSKETDIPKFLRWHFPQTVRIKKERLKHNKRDENGLVKDMSKTFGLFEGQDGEKISAIIRLSETVEIWSSGTMPQRAVKEIAKILSTFEASSPANFLEQRIYCFANRSLPPPPSSGTPKPQALQKPKAIYPNP